jgi:DNA-directed RNA polymerase subunit E'/Rpb7
MNKLYNPFITTTLTTQIVLHPSQLNNDLYLNLKSNLELRLKNKCYKNYGYITDIYEIVEYSQGKIINEDNDANVLYDVKFTCKICNPIENTQIICKIRQNSETLLNLYRSPMVIIVRHERINTSKFEIDPFNGKIKLINGSILMEGEYVKVTILKTQFIDKDTQIISLGILDDIIDDDEIKDFFNDYYSEEIKNIPN